MKCHVPEVQESSHQILHHLTRSRTESRDIVCERMFQHTARCGFVCHHTKAPNLYRGRGDRPSQTTRLAVSLCRIHGKRLELKQNKGGISLLTPSRLAPRLQSLPPMLHMLCPDPMPRYSKASRGLSVHMRVTGVFTGTTSSPSPWSRQ